MATAIEKKPCMGCGHKSYTLYCDACCGGTSGRWDLPGDQSRVQLHRLRETSRFPSTRANRASVWRYTE